MTKLIMPVSLYSVRLIVAIIAITLSHIGQAGAAITNIEQTKMQIISLINSGKMAEADTSIDKFIAGAPISVEKGTALQQIAGTYQNAGQADKAIKLCDYVIQIWPNDDIAVWVSMSKALAQFDKGDITATGETVQKMITGYADNSGLSPALWVIADKYSWQKMYERSEKLFDVIKEKFPDSPWATKARVGINTMKILRLIEDGTFSSAREQLFSSVREQVDVMIVDFNNEPALADALFRIGQEISWRRQYGNSKYVLDRLIERFPDGPLALKAKLWSARAGICDMIKNKQDEDAFEATVAMINVFHNDAGLPETVQWISKECEWSKGESIINAGRYDTAGKLYQLLQQFKGGDYAQQAQWDQKRMAYRTKILMLMDNGSQNEVDAAIEQMITELTGRSELPGEIYWVSIWYKQRYKYDKAGEICERIVAEYPDSNYADESASDVINFAADADANADANGAVGPFISRLRSHLGQTPRLAMSLGVVGKACYEFAENCDKLKADPNKTKTYKEKAADIYVEVILLAGNSEMAPIAYLHLAKCYRGLQRFSDAENCCKEINRRWPGSWFESECQSVR